MRRGLAAGVTAGVAAGVTVGLVLAVGGCGQAAGRSAPEPAPASSSTGPATPGAADYTVTVDGQKRQYRAYVPNNPKSTAPQTRKPVVIFLHGGGGNGELFARVAKMDTVAEEGGFVVVYPNGSGRLGDRLLTWNAGDCCAYAKDHDIDDVAFVGALIDDVTARLGTDPDRVFVTGFSNGAMMTYRLGCELADRITAIAVVSGAMNLDTCRPTKQLPVLIMHGTADTAVPYNGGPSSSEFPTAGTWTNRSVQHAVDFWTRHNACQQPPTESRDGEVERHTYPCAKAVTVYTIEGGGHGWPGGEKARANAKEPTPPRPDASRVIWKFFQEA